MKRTLGKVRQFKQWGAQFPDREKHMERFRTAR